MLIDIDIRLIYLKTTIKSFIYSSKITKNYNNEIQFNNNVGDKKSVSSLFQ